MPLQLKFLPNKGCLLDDKAKTQWTIGLDSFLKDILRGAVSAEKHQIKQTLFLETVVLQDGQYASVICYKDTADEKQIRHSHSLSLSHPRLAKWINRKSRDGSPLHDAESLQVSLGPRGEYFASSNLGYCWGGVGDDFHEDMQEMIAGGGGWLPGRTPNTVSFGMNGSYLVTTRDSKYIKMNKECYKYYRKLYDELKENDEQKDLGHKYITLNPYENDEWLILWTNDTVTHMLPNISKTISQMIFGDSPPIEPRLSTASSSTTSLARPAASQSQGSPSSTSSQSWKASSSSLRNTGMGSHGGFQTGQSAARPPHHRPSYSINSPSPLYNNTHRISAPSYQNFTPTVYAPYSPNTTIPHRSELHDFMTVAKGAFKVMNLASNLASGNLGGGGGTSLLTGTTPMGIDPSSMLNMGGMDPTQLQAQGCSIM